MEISEIRTNHRPRLRRFYSPYLGEARAVRIPGLTPAEEKALRLTTTFETGRPLNFSRLAGNFDGQGISFGLLQWNFGRRSLQPLLREFARSHPSRFQAAFGPQTGRMSAVLNASYADQMRFARSINDARNRIVEPWATSFQSLGTDPAFQRLQLRHVRPRLNRAARYARQFGLRTERGFALMFDTVTQNGGNWLNVRGRARLIAGRRAAFRRRTGRPPNERELLGIIANVIADTVNPRWRENVRRRRMTIVNGRGRVHGHNFDLKAEFGITDAPWEPGAGNLQATALSSPDRFLEQVLQAHIARSTRRRGAASPDLGASQLSPVQGTNIQMRSDAARAASQMIAAANRDLAMARQAGHRDGLRTTRISATSGYRSRSHQERLWRGYFRSKYYPQTAVNRAGLPGGPHGDAAVRFMVRYVSGRIAAPGFSNHQAGLAIDLKQHRTRGNAIRNSTSSTAVRRWRSTWFYQWLRNNASRFNFVPYAREPWHWTYRP